MAHPVIDFLPSSLFPLTSYIFHLTSSIFHPVRHGQDHEEEGQQIVGDIIGIVALCDIVQRQLCPQDIRQVGLVIDVTVAEQRDGHHTQDGHHTADDGLCLPRCQSPRPDAHDQGSGQSVDTEQRIAYCASNENIDSPQIVLVSHTTEPPQQRCHSCGAEGRYKEVPPQFQQIEPVALVHVGQQQDGDGYQQHDGPTVGDAEGPFRECHQHPPPGTEQQHTQPRVVQELRKPCAQPCEQAPGHYQLLLQV